LELSNIRAIGIYLYTYFSFFLLLAGAVLLIAMIGAISLTMELNILNKQQVLYKQVNVDPKHFMFYIK
jgi:NADH-quinone oxidoreductase subunit J